MPYISLWDFADEIGGDRPHRECASRLLNFLVSRGYAGARIRQQDWQHLNDQIAANDDCLKRWGRESQNVELFAQRVQIDREHFDDFRTRFFVADQRYNPTAEMRQRWFREILIRVGDAYGGDDQGEPPRKPALNVEEPAVSPTRFTIQSNSGGVVNNIDEWRDCVSASHWGDGNGGAGRLANAFDDGFPDPLRALLRTNPLTHDFAPRTGTIERRTPFDGFPGNVRNHDLLLNGEDVDNRVRLRHVVALEAKGVEPFGERVGPYYEANGIERSNIRKRIELLAVSLYGRPIDEPIRQLRYQLLHALAGTLAEAEKAGAHIGVLVVWEFRKAANHARNHEDFERFVHSFAPLREIPIEDVGNASSAIYGLFGPFTVPGGTWIPGNIPVLIGKISTPWR
jgi:hypothetical protein